MIASYCKELVSHVRETSKQAAVWRPHLWAMIKGFTVNRRLRKAPVSDRSFAAFISYSHGHDRQLARVLQTGIEQFGRPWYRPRVRRVFRDDTNLAADP
jgi:hypothetical protein